MVCWLHLGICCFLGLFSVCPCRHECIQAPAGRPYTRKDEVFSKVEETVGLAKDSCKDLKIEGPLFEYCVSDNTQTYRCSDVSSDRALCIELQHFSYLLYVELELNGLDKSNCSFHGALSQYLGR